ncbi:MAG: hypothetical protein KC476_10135 [Cyanobacteria bacterium HKST-UBA06]|nr:hypothetical protein [Cyanobacteria bacterium HKST-UBA04]MCA9808301.1 hypothetical protein [Cyanobacteria bacterium HKST-UBA06]MCA9842654.1 hypothetical protein [Cyanobacteria bacterium HKST-UBA03]
MMDNQIPGATTWHVACVASDKNHLDCLAEAFTHPNTRVDTFYIPDETSMPNFSGSPHKVVVEWLDGSEDMKFEGLSFMSGLMDKKTLFLSASLAFLPSELAYVLPNPAMLVGFDPIPFLFQKRTTTVAPALQTSLRTQRTLRSFFEKIEMPVHWIQETPGMVMPRIYAMLANEAAFAVQHGIATVKDIDTAMTLGTNYPMGPLAWADKVGLRVVYTILQYCWETYRDDRYRPSLLLYRLMGAGQTFYQYHRHQHEQAEAASRLSVVGSGSSDDDDL